jgi:hypothetical protein
LKEAVPDDGAAFLLFASCREAGITGGPLYKMIQETGAFHHFKLWGFLESFQGLSLVG